MAAKKGLLSRIFGGGKAHADTGSDCCSVQIEEVPADEQDGDQAAAVSNRASAQGSVQTRSTDATARK